jgi:hypothetical protein
MNPFDQNLSGRMLLASIQRHLAQEHVAYQASDSAFPHFRSDAGREAFSIVNRRLNQLELEFRDARRSRQIKREARRRAA